MPHRHCPGAQKPREAQDLPPAMSCRLAGRRIFGDPRVELFEAEVVFVKDVSGRVDVERLLDLCAADLTLPKRKGTRLYERSDS